MGVIRPPWDGAKMRILHQEWLRPKRIIVGTIAKIRAKKNVSPLQGGKGDLILIWRCTDEILNGCGNLPIKRPNKYCVNEKKHEWQKKEDIRYGFRFARRSELEMVDDIKSGSTRKVKKILIETECLTRSNL